MGQTASMCRVHGSCLHHKKSLQLRSIEEPPGGAGGGMPAPTCYDAQCARTEAWLDENQEFVHDYFLRKATRQVVDAWLVSHATPPSAELASPSRAGSGSGATTPVRKISAHEFERGGLLKPLVTTVDGTPTFLGDQPHATPSRPQRRSRHELKQLDEKELIFELVKDICNELEVRVLCHKILQNVSILLDADRGSLFLVQGEKASSPKPQNGRCLVSKLFDVCSKSTPEQMEQLEEIRIPWGSGIVGYVAESGEPVNIPDAYKDERFNHDIDQQTGYKTRSLLCMPIKDINGEVIGVAQVINKQNDGIFTPTDEKVFASYLQFCGIGLRNATLYERSQLEVKRNQVLLDLARMVFEEQSTIEFMVLRILTHTQSLIRCQRVQVLLVHEASKGSFSRVFDLEAGDDAEPGTPRTSPYESRFPINIGITGYVATTGETVNIPDAYMDPRFDPSVDEGAGFKHNTILCMAIKNSEGRIIGVIQLVNKFDDLLFTKNDENFVEAFAIFCGMGIHNTHMYEKAITAMAKQSVTLDVLSYHASASLDDAHRLRTLRIPSSAHFKLHDLEFDDIEMSDEETVRACLRMFLDLDFVERFHIDYGVLCRWLLSVKKNYRNVAYHNWRHAFNVAQMMFAILTETQWWKIFGELECLALIIGCLCHDLDHRGTNNSFQIKASSPLAQLYSTSTMEHHHFDQCLMILSSPGNQILANLSSEDYEKVVKVLEDAILSTDLAVYFSKRKAFIEAVSSERSVSVTGASGPVSASWSSCGERRGLLRAMLMTACDLAAITKPWPVERRVAALVAGEFFRQGDLERQNLNLTPIDIMNRDKEDQLPAMQVKFIDTICLPIYEAFAVLSPALQPLLDRVKSNRAHWIELNDRNEKFDYGQELHNDKSSNSSHVDDTEPYEGDSSGAVSLSSETNSRYDNLENPVVGLVCSNALMRDKFCHINDVN
ncbi:dual 3',5'-cyclic-AMP and -GMP phosphodiesterase 11-like isoform X2 [Leptidea sinapis]|uniref:dual 3',5'-cyclic-AMP and -GMP phosphodiesterase 11-like isoform X2 n=1 Tax=Leptidea sinapis TaxID=189913 RepID=UPI00213E7A61|nr:dual 3',5'-cyclic-AMP and -GMP phosphodiesterase 11-like isoform X2 [Leptidea sinapis]XP_050665694.1 dual 3',5'-cyclic-AMP and -GMP phosphodiesterase 11-like isoform X2 [Leptidea sinapis]XP_050665695.1 dual 3',5'-cyclic-AMP and -GMP phosphodiesterase 11-like isoform X2 [Leptidea sinapis]XP_050665696.1 dual 3',5'-cyclic-AMP and -GMP phosphodiesterase 11-like isoform X2 [Leptidea sinapis]